MDYRWRIMTIWFVLMLAGCDQPELQTENDRLLSESELASIQKDVKTQENVFRFGFDLRISPQEDARQYLPFLNYLERATGYRFELRFTATGDDIVADLGSGKIDFAAVGAVSFIKAQRQHGAVALALGVNSLGKSAYRSFFVVRPDSPITRIEELRGQQLAFGSTTSTQGYLIPRIVLQQHGLGLADLGGYHFTGSHQNCADALVAMRADVCGMQDALAERLAEQGIVRILYRSEYYPSSGIAASSSVPDEVIVKVRNALFEFDPLGRDKEGLYAWQNTEMPLGFTEIDPQGYHRLKKYMQKFQLIKED